jgi:hypothetical protein
MPSAFQESLMTAPDKQHQQNRLYPVRLGLEYRLKEAGRVVTVGTGRTISLSRSRVLLESDNGLPPDALVELAVSWPVQLENKVRLKLVIVGRTVQVNGKFITVDILRHEFRTRALLSQRHRLSPGSPSSGRTATASAY